MGIGGLRASGDPASGWASTRRIYQHRPRSSEAESNGAPPCLLLTQPPYSRLSPSSSAIANAQPPGCPERRRSLRDSAVGIGRLSCCARRRFGCFLAGAADGRGRSQEGGGGSWKEKNGMHARFILSFISRFSVSDQDGKEILEILISCDIDCPHCATRFLSGVVQ